MRLGARSAFMGKSGGAAYSRACALSCATISAARALPSAAEGGVAAPALGPPVRPPLPGGQQLREERLNVRQQRRLHVHGGGEPRRPLPL